MSIFADEPTCTKVVSSKIVWFLSNVVNQCPNEHSSENDPYLKNHPTSSRLLKGMHCYYINALDIMKKKRLIPSSNKKLF